MEIGVEERKDIIFNPPIEDNPEIFGAMSMAVQRTGDYYSALHREVHRAETTEPIPESVLAFTSSVDGVVFERSGVIALKPSKTPGSPDYIAVEDPTIVKIKNEEGKDFYYVFHTAVRPASGGSVETAIQLATGTSLEKIGNKAIILTPNDVKKELGPVNMVKEPEFFQLPDGAWVMIYEISDNVRSRIAMATSLHLTGPYQKHRLLLDIRPESWDSQHTSAGPLFLLPGGDICMFYNGRGPRSEVDQTPTWAIGYAIIDTRRWSVLRRSDSPLIIPPQEIGPGNQLIAFANSLVGEGNRRIQTLYYTIADKRSACAKIVTDL